MKIRVACQGAATVSRESLVIIQGEKFKTLAPVDAKKMRNEILERGFSFAIHAWREPLADGGFRLCVLDGTQRLRVVDSLIAEGWECPELPVVYVDAESFEEAAKKLLSGASQYGTPNLEGVTLFAMTVGLDTKAFENIKLTGLKDIEIAKEIAVQVAAHERRLNGGGEESPAPEEAYSKKVVAPHYEPKGDNPAVDTLLDHTKANQLAAEIEAAVLPADVKAFLLAAARRHTVFHYDRIAEFYAHAPKEVQELMERSALVIIDFNKAIEGGYVRLSEEFAEAYRSDDENQ